MDHYLVEGNICYNAHIFLIGGGKPSHHIAVRQNALYGVSMQLGYDAPYNEDCEVRDNLIVDGTLAINHYRKVVNEGNRVVGASDPRPSGTRIILHPNRYEPGRANLAIFNFDRKAVLEVDLSPVLKRGERFRLVDPRAFFGKPVLAGMYGGRPIEVPMTGEFAAFVLLGGSARSGLGQRLLHGQDLPRDDPAIDVEFLRRPEVGKLVLGLHADGVPDRLQLLPGRGGGISSSGRGALLGCGDELLQGVYVAVVVVAFAIGFPLLNR